MLRPLRPSLAILVAALAVAGCGDRSSVAGPSLDPHALALRANEAEGYYLLRCPTGGTAAGTGIIGERGGEVGTGDAQISVPESAVEGDAFIQVTVPASTFVEAEFHANGREHYTFSEPVEITLDYSRCTGIADDARLRAVYIDEDTKRVLEDMGGATDPVARTVTFTTTHFSSYALAY